MPIDRENSKNALATVLKQEKNINIIEKHIYNISRNKEEKYNNILYQIIGDIINNKPLSQIIDEIKSNKILWEHNSFNEMADCIREQNEFIQNPFEVEEGVFQCKACGSKRVYSYARQDRSCDEGTSVYAQCVACKTKWRERG
jgi:DNA-directed RNA polymerase subunit M/transcription elongation factor TFIIS